MEYVRYSGKLRGNMLCVNIIQTAQVRILPGAPLDQHGCKSVQSAWNIAHKRAGHAATAGPRHGQPRIAAQGPRRPLRAKRSTPPSRLRPSEQCRCDDGLHDAESRFRAHEFDFEPNWRLG